MSWLNLASWIPCTEVEGPGKRAALWVQGCDKRCIGCCNPGYLKIMERDILSAETMIERLLAAHDEWDLEGVTFLGGEPFLQAQGLAAGVRQSLTVASCILIVGLVLSFFIKRNTNEEAENNFDEEKTVKFIEEFDKKAEFLETKSE